MRIFRCVRELPMQEIGIDGKPLPGADWQIPVGAVYTAEDLSEVPQLLESLWGGKQIRLGREILEKHFEELG